MSLICMRWMYILQRSLLCISNSFMIYTSLPRSAPTKDQVRSLFLPIVLLKMRYENVKLQMIPWGPANSICEEYLKWDMRMWSYKWDWISRSPGSPWFHGGQQTRFVKNTIQYDSKSKHSKRRQTVNWTWEVACWFSFSLSLKISAVTYTTACARVRFCFWKASAQRFFRWEVVRHARACSRCACACPRSARGRPRRLLLSRPLGGSAAKWTNVVWPIKSRQTNTHYSFIGIDIYIYIYIYIIYMSYYVYLSVCM